MNRDDWLGFSRTAVAVAVAVAVVAAAPALAQNTTAAVNGRVTGADGAPVAGATVLIVHVESGSSNSVTRPRCHETGTWRPDHPGHEDGQIALPGLYP